jgi:hypothetical protein
VSEVRQHANLALHQAAADLEAAAALREAAEREAARQTKRLQSAGAREAQATQRNQVSQLVPPLAKSLSALLEALLLAHRGLSCLVNGDISESSQHHFPCLPEYLCLKPSVQVVCLPVCLFSCLFREGTRSPSWTC